MTLARSLSFIIHLQAELHALQLLCHVKGNSPPSSSQPVLSKKPVSLHCNSPATGAIPPHLCDPSKIVALQLHTDL